MSSLSRVLHGPKAHQTAEGDGPMLKENHQQVKNTNEAEPQNWPETREVFPRQVNFLDTIRAPDILARKQRRQGRAVTVLGIGYCPTLFLCTCERVVVLLAYGQETLESEIHNIRINTVTPLTQQATTGGRYTQKITVTCNRLHWEMGALEISVFIEAKTTGVLLTVTRYIVQQARETAVRTY